MSGTALVFFDYALTFSTEVSEIWHSKSSGAQALFFLTRYSFMIFTGLLCAVDLIQNPSETLCRGISFSLRVSFTLAHIGLYGILTLRTYAIYQRNRFILVILGLICVASVGNGLSLVLGKPKVDSSVFGGICDQTRPPSLPRIQLAGTILSLTIDLLVFTLTFAKTIHHTIEMRKVGLRNGLGYFILRDGAMYFLAKLLIGVVGTIVFFVPASVAIGDWLSVVTTMSNPLTFILINRLVLNLRQVSQIQEGNATTLGSIGTIQEPAFAVNSLLGNLGAPLRMGRANDDEIEEFSADYEAEVVEEREIMNNTEIVEERRNLSDV